MPWAASSFTLTQVAAGKPAASWGADRAPWARSTSRPTASRSAVVTPGTAAASMASRASATARPARSSPRRSSSPSIVMLPNATGGPARGNGFRSCEVEAMGSGSGTHASGSVGRNLLPRDTATHHGTMESMTAQLLAGAPVAEAVLDDVAVRVAALRERGKTVGLGTILVGDDPASAGYVRKKHETCERVGMLSHHIDVPGDGTQADLLAAVDRFNADPAVDAYLIQHPVPPQFDFNAALGAIDPDKDGDGLHPVSLGKLVLQEEGPVPATPAGIQAMFVHYGIDIAGKHVVIVGRGPTLGRPLSLLLTLKQAGRQRRGHRRPHRRARHGRLHPGGRRGGGGGRRRRRSSRPTWSARAPSWSAAA